MHVRHCRKPETAFNSETVAVKACRSGQNPLDIARAFGEIVREPLKRALEHSRLYDPFTYSRDYLGRSVLEGVFASFDQDQPIVAVKSFSLDPQGVLQESLTHIPNTDSNMTFSGEYEAALAYKNSLISPAANNSELVKRLIEVEIAAKREAVGPPVSILKITRAGRQWTGPGACPLLPSP